MLLKYDFFKKIQKKSIKTLQPLKIGALGKIHILRGHKNGHKTGVKSGENEKRPILRRLTRCLFYNKVYLTI